ncbi:MAG: DUF6146 family protein [Bacteroidales bacterium]|nr:DUF6146 family protein [Bacteroidales bacterium]MCF8403573.1 DUF6146 family protein [Bacteroidales bacterium]
MIRLSLYLLAFLLFIGCHSSKSLVISEAEASGMDTTEYQIMIAEPGYDSWVATNRRPVEFHSLEYYKNFNKLYVSEWNHRVLAPMSDFPYDYQIDYDWQVDYGLDVEYQLFWFFKFVQDKYNIKLLSTERK